MSTRITAQFAAAVLLFTFGMPMTAAAQDQYGLELVNSPSTFNTWRDAAVSQLTTNLNALKAGNQDAITKNLQDILNTSIEQLSGINTDNLDNKSFAQASYGKADTPLAAIKLVGAGAQLYAAALKLAFDTLAGKGTEVGPLLDKTLDFLIAGAKALGNKAEQKKLEEAKALLKDLKAGKDVLDKLQKALDEARKLVAVSTQLVPQSSPSGQAIVAITVSGLGDTQPPSLGAFQFDVGFDPAVLVPTSVTFGPFLGDPSRGEAVIDFSFLDEIVRFSGTSFLSPTALATLQPTEFTLATFFFNQVNVGDGRPFLADVVLTDAFGDNLLAPGTPLSEVPEPASLYLLGSALIIAGSARRIRVWLGPLIESRKRARLDRPVAREASRQDLAAPR